MPVIYYTSVDMSAWLRTVRWLVCRSRGVECGGRQHRGVKQEMLAKVQCKRSMLQSNMRQGSPRRSVDDLLIPIQLINPKQSLSYLTHKCALTAYSVVVPL